MVVRRPKVSEAQTILDLHARTVREVNSRDYTPAEIEAWLANQSLDKIEARIRRGEAYVCVDAHGALIGFGGRAGREICALYIAPEYLGQGIGSQLLAQMESDAADEGIDELVLTSTLTAVGFYKHHGYVAVEKARCFAAGEQGLEAVAMRRRLT